MVHFTNGTLYQWIRGHLGHLGPLGYLGHLSHLAVTTDGFVET